MKRMCFLIKTMILTIAYFVILLKGLCHAELCHENLKAVWKRNTFSTPGFPIPYIGNLNCSWLISADAGSQIELKFFIVDLEPEYDTLKIYDGKDEKSPLLSVLHGRIHVPEAIISSAGHLFLRFSADDSVAKRGFRAQYRLALSTKMNVTSVIQSCLADTTITREVYNSDTVPREVEFKIVFPHEAYVTEFEMTVGGVKYFGQVEKKESVKQKYQEVDVQWVSMGYVSSTRDLAKKFFTGILLMPKQTVKFEIVYQQLLQRRLGRYTNTIVLTRDFLLSDLSVDIYICARSKLSFLQVPPMEDAGSMSYIGQVRFLGRRDNFPPDVKVEKENNVAHISYRSSREGGDGPLQIERSVFVTHYDVEREDHGALSVFGGEYFATFFSPVSPNLVRRIVFVLDVSGSMAGNKIKQVKIAMKNILKRLTRRDSFNIVQFESVVRKWKPVGLIAATSEAKLSAQKYLDSFDPEGKTNINDALITGIKLLSTGKGVINRRMRSVEVNPYRDFVFFLGDGKPTVGVRNPKTILQAVQIANKRGYGINAIGFGKNVDVPFLQRLTRENNGKWRIIYDDDDSHVQIQNFITELGVPIMTDITFNYSPKQVNFTTRRRNLVLVNGGEVGVFGRLLPNLTDEYMNVTVTGKTFQRLSNTFSFPLNRKKTQCESISENLVEEFVGRGYGIAKLEETLKRLRESIDEDENEELTNAATDISLEFNLVTPVTSLVVKKQNQTKDEEKQKPQIEERPNRGSKEPPTKKPVGPGQLVEGLPGKSSPWVFEGDPHFIVALGNNITVCFTWNGTDGQIYNLLNDPITGVTLNGLIKYGPRSPKANSSHECTLENPTMNAESLNDEHKNDTCVPEIESYFVKLGFVFPKERIKVEVTTRDVSIRDERIPKHTIEETFPTSDDDVHIIRGGISIKAYDITKVHSFVNITLNGTISFVINQKRGRNYPEDKKRPSLIDHLDLDIVGHQNLSPYTQGLFGMFPRDVREDFRGKKDRDYPVARLRRPGKEHLLQYRQRRISVDKISITDPYSKTPRDCWFTYEENLVTGRPDDAFRIKNIFGRPRIPGKFRYVNKDI